jgi:hypothetical protein
MTTIQDPKTLAIALCEAEETYRAAIQYRRRHPTELGRLVELRAHRPLDELERAFLDETRVCGSYLRRR